MDWTTLASLGLVSVASAFEETERFPIGYWFGPPVEHTSVERYAEIAAAHFSLALPQGGGPHLPEENIAMLDAAAAHGLQCIVADDRLTPAMLRQPDGADLLSRILRDKKCKLRIEVPEILPGGVAIYGKDFGRFPLDPTLIFSSGE